MAPKNFSLIQEIFRKYSKRFSVKIEQISIQHDHIHLLIRATKRTEFQAFFRVIAGQIAQKFKGEGLLRTRKVTDTPGKLTKFWKYRPFSRVVSGLSAYKTVRNYIQLNEKEALGEIKYRKTRLQGLTPEERTRLWDKTPMSLW